MGFAGENQLHRTLRIGKQSNQPFRIVQQKIGPLISRKPARKADRQHVFIENLGKIVWTVVSRCALARVAHANPVDQVLTRAVAQLP